MSKEQAKVKPFFTQPPNIDQHPLAFITWLVMSAIYCVAAMWFLAIVAFYLWESAGWLVKQIIKWAPWLIIALVLATVVMHVWWRP